MRERPSRRKPTRPRASACRSSRRISRLEKDYADLEEEWKAEKAQVQGSQHIKEEIEKLRHQMAELQRKGQYDKLAELQYGRLPQLEAQLKKAESTEKDAKPKLLRTQVGAGDCRGGLARDRHSGLEDDAGRARQARAHGRSCTSAWSARTRRYASFPMRSAVRAQGLADPNRPYGSFLPRAHWRWQDRALQGARRVPLRLRGASHPNRHVEYGERHSVARLIGAAGLRRLRRGRPAHRAGAAQARRILFDEVEKAHADVFNVFLQILDEGRLTDGQGRTVDFKNTVLVMTSNLGSQMIQSMAGSDYQVVKRGDGRGQDALPSGVREPHRRDRRVPRARRGAHQVHRQDPAQRAQEPAGEVDYALDVSEAALTEIAKVGFDPVYGARPLKRAIQSEIENPLAKSILEGRFAPKDTIAVDHRGGKMVFETKKTVRAAA